MKHEPRETISADEAGKTPLWGPTAVVERSDGTLFFVERDAQIIREYHPNRGMRSVFDLSQRGRWYEAAEAPLEGTVREYHPVSPCTLALDNQERLHLCDTFHASVLRVDVAGGVFKRVVLTHREPEVYVDRGPLAVAFGPDGTAWLADSADESIQAYEVSVQGDWFPLGKRLTSVDGEPLVLSPGGMGLVLHQ
ncbi:MAG: SMP-30/gluconolactonase/LRE family protein [Acidobacteria bacterium]|nr:SMP-30/gluconolactonase/LRE family protein [Acidobacteriota bacterium]